MSKFTINTQSNTPSTPASGKVTFWPGTDGIWRSVDEFGVVTIYTPLTTEQIQDIVGAFIQAGSNKIAVNYNDPGNVFTIDVNQANLIIASSQISDKGVANGVASLDSGGKVPASQLPSFVDDVVEYANLAAFPVTGETGKIYVALDTNKTYRWSGSAYVEISPSEVNSVFGRTGIVTAQNGDYTASQITNVPAGNITQATVQLALNQLDTIKQAVNALLTAISGLASNGFIVRTGSGSAAARSIAATAGHINVANGDGVSGNPTLSLPNVGTAGTYGAGDAIPVVTTDAQGRSSVTTTPTAPKSYRANATSRQNTTSTTFAQLDSMSITPPSGTYRVCGNVDADTVGNDTGGEIELRVDGSSVTGSMRQKNIDVTATFGGTGAVRGSLNVDDTITVNGSQAIQIYYRSTNGGQTFTIRNRTLLLSRVTP